MYKIQLFAVTSEKLLVSLMYSFLGIINLMS